MLYILADGIQCILLQPAYLCLADALPSGHSCVRWGPRNLTSSAEMNSACGKILLRKMLVRRTSGGSDIFTDGIQCILLQPAYLCLADADFVGDLHLRFPLVETQGQDAAFPLA